MGQCVVIIRGMRCDNMYFLKKYGKGLVIMGQYAIIIICTICTFLYFSLMARTRVSLLLRCMGVTISTF